MSELLSKEILVNAFKTKVRKRYKMLYAFYKDILDSEVFPVSVMLEQIKKDCGLELTARDITNLKFRLKGEKKDKSSAIVVENSSPPIREIPIAKQITPQEINHDKYKNLDTPDIPPEQDWLNKGFKKKK